MKKLLFSIIIPFVLFILTISTIVIISQYISWQYRDISIKQAFNEQIVTIENINQPEFEFIEKDNFKKFEMSYAVKNRSTIRQTYLLNISLQNSDSSLDLEVIVPAQSEEIVSIPFELGYLSKFDQNPYEKFVNIKIFNKASMEIAPIENSFPINLKLLNDNELVSINPSFEFNNTSYSGNSEVSELPAIDFKISFTNKTDRKFDSGFYEINLLDSDKNFVQQLLISEFSLSDVHEENELSEKYFFNLPPAGMLNENSSKEFFIEYKYKGVVADRVVEISKISDNTFEFNLQNL